MIDWKSILLGEENWMFLIQVVLRSFIMFVVVLVSLRLMGKRAVMQGVFEVAMIIALGSAAGDAMFYSKVGLLPAIVVFASIIIIYKIINHFMALNTHFEKFLQGQLVCLIKDGAFVLKSIKKEQLASNEIFSDLRLEGASQIGQIKHAYIEPSGNLSVFFYEVNETRYGLPILPEHLKEKSNLTKENGYYSCIFCADTLLMPGFTKFICRKCGHHECVKSVNDKKII